MNGATAEGYSEDWDLEALWNALKLLYPVGIDHHDLIDSGAVGEPGELTREELLGALLEDAERAYAVREAELTEIGGETAMRQLERSVLLTTVDRKWREHLYEMDYLKEGIGLRAMAQRDPLVEYQREGYDMFMGMLDGLKEESVGLLFNAQVQAAPSPAVAPVAAPPNLAQFAADAAAKAQEASEPAAAQGAVATERTSAGAAAGVARQGNRRRRRSATDVLGTVRGRIRAGAAARRGNGSGGRHAAPATAAPRGVSDARPRASRAAARSRRARRAGADRHQIRSGACTRSSRSAMP